MKRVATIRDVNAIARIQVQSWRAAYRDILPNEFLASLSERKHQEFWAQMIEEELGDCVIWEQASQVVGFANLGRILDVRSTGGKHLELYVIYFIPELYGSGEGTRFWKEIEAGLEADCVWVWCLERNRLGRRFYEKNGFSLVEGETKDFVWREASFREIRYRKFLSKGTGHPWRS